MNAACPPDGSPWWRRFGGRRWIGLAFVALALGTVAPYLVPSTELVRLRNALQLGPDFLPAQDWQPPAVPAGWRAESAPAPRYFAALAASLNLAAQPDDWARAVAISGHLLTSAPGLNGGAVQHDLEHTHRAIVQRGDGYCGDFVRAFTAIAGAAGMPLRTWAFSFDGFGGHGHILVEIWNRQRLSWQVVDVYNNYWFAGPDGHPLGALALRERLQREQPVSLRLLDPRGRPGYEVEAKAWAYYRRGLDQWYLNWGSNPFAVDASLPVRAFAGVSRAAENGGALLSGVAPQVRILAEPTNAGLRAELRALRARLHVAGVTFLVGALLLAWPRRRRRAVARARAGAAGWPAVCVVGPLPPPSGGMANQCEQLVRLLRAEGCPVSLVQTNPPYRPALLGRLPVLRAVLRLLPYLARLWSGIGRAQVVHVFANSGWAWHLMAMPALRIARWRGVPAIVNYRGGQAAEFFARAPARVRADLHGAALRVTPSVFLQRVFARHGLEAEIVPNIVDLTRFVPRPASAGPVLAPHLVVTRNLEVIYDIPTALHAFARVRAELPAARLTVAGSGPELAALQRLAAELGVAEAVRFAGRIPNERIGALYAEADVVLNPSTADNMPISILEALASGVPVVSTDAGGIPDVVENGRTALLVPVGDATAMAAAALRLLRDEPALARRLSEAGLKEAARYAWPQVRARWREVYWRLAGGPDAPAGEAQASVPLMGAR